MSGAPPSPSAPTTDVLLLAGGASSRMGPGRDKLLQEVAGRPLLRLMAERAQEAAGVREVLAVLRPDRPARRAALEGLALRPLIAPQALDGMGGSIAAGVGALSPGWRAVVILPADMPEIDSADIARLIAAHETLAAGAPDAVLRGAGPGGVPGHPVLFGAGWAARLRALSGEEGARALVARAGPALRLVPLPARHALTDLDTPEEWRKWNAAQEDPPAPRRPYR